MDRVSLTYDQATAILDLICEREAERINERHAWVGLTDEARSGLELLRAAKHARRGTDNRSSDGWSGMSNPRPAAQK